MDALHQLLVFRLGGERYALGLESVERVFRAVAVTPLPQAPECILGVVNVQGRIVPVFNLRRRFNIPGKEVVPSDQMIVARAKEQAFALVADEVLGVMGCPREALVAAGDILPRLECIEGVVKLAEGLAFIHDADSFFTSAEKNVIRGCLTSSGATEDG